MKFESIPRPLLRKLLLTPTIGAGCLILGIAIYLAMHDRTLLFLSGVLFGVSGYRTMQLYHIIRDKKYQILVGTCIAVLPRFPGQIRKIRILLDDTNEEQTLRLPKQYHFRVGGRYRFYFACRDDVPLSTLQTSAFLDSLVADSFLGFSEENEKA